MIAPAIIAAGISAGGGLLGGLFGGKGDDGSTPTVTPWRDTTEQWQYDDLKRGVELGGQNREEAAQLKDWLAKNPAVLSGMSDMERSALERRFGALEGAQGYDDAALGLYGPGTYMGELVADPESAMGDIYGRYENPFLDSVVDTTLEGMDRQAMRESAMRGGSVAASGGMSGTRAAVGDAIAQQLHGMNMGEMEAKLRSEGFDKAIGYGMDEIGMVGGLTGDMADLYSGMGDRMWDRTNQFADYESGFGQEQRKINDINRESARTGHRDALNWYNAGWGNPSLAGPTSSMTPGTPQSPGWAQGLGIGSDLASAYLSQGGWGGGGGGITPPSSALMGQVQNAVG